MYKCPRETTSKFSAKGNTVALNSCGIKGINNIKDVKQAEFSQ